VARGASTGLPAPLDETAGDPHLHLDNYA
jgi:hypothetical protein